MEEMEVEENLGPDGLVHTAGVAWGWPAWRYVMEWQKGSFWMMYVRGWEMRYLKRGAWAPARSASITGRQDARCTLSRGNSSSSQVYIGFPNHHSWVSKT